MEILHDRIQSNIIDNSQLVLLDKDPSDTHITGDCWDTNDILMERLYKNNGAR